MKRLHVNLKVNVLQESIAFYNAVFNAEPTIMKTDYAKWSLKDPKVNFSISLSENSQGLNHLGIEFETQDELYEFNERIKDVPQLRDEGHTVCCYAQSEKSWLNDPQNIEWEFFHTYGAVDKKTVTKMDEAPCCETTCC